MNKPVCYVDMDSILADMLGGCFDGYVAATGLARPHVEDVDTWDWKFPNGDSLYTYFSVPGFFAKLKPLPGAVAGVCSLKDMGYDVRILTSAPFRTAPTEKFDWIAEHLPGFKLRDVIVSSHKGVLGHLLIDDYAENAKAFVSANPYGFVATLAYGYNNDSIYGNARFKTWPEIVDFAGKVL